jgi:hypothetical protein
MSRRNLRFWLPCLNMVFGSGLLILGYIQYRVHQAALRQTKVLYEFDYLPSAFHWLAALYAPCGLLAFPVAAIPGIPKPVVAVWFVMCIGFFWYWLASQLDASSNVESQTASRKKPSGQLLNWLGVAFGVLLCILSASAFRRGAWPLLIDACGFIWGVGIGALFVGKIRKGRGAGAFSEEATT